MQVEQRVSQRARDAAADLYLEEQGAPYSAHDLAIANDIRVGDRDDWAPAVGAFARFEASLPPSAPVDRDAAIETMARAMLKPWVHRDFNDEELAGARKDATAAYDALAALTPSVLAESTSNDCLLVAEGWQDIATLKDEDGYVLGWSPRSDGFSVREYFMGCRYDIRTDALINEWTGRWRAVTHWRALPAPPAVTDLSGVGVG